MMQTAGRTLVELSMVYWWILKKKEALMVHAHTSYQFDLFLDRFIFSSRFISLSWRRESSGGV